MKRVVIIGGGFCGSQVAQKLESKFDVTLIDDKEYWEFTPSVLRVLVEPEYKEKIRVKHKSYLKKSKIVVGIVKEVGKDYVKINGKKVNFDYLVISNGAYYHKFMRNVLVATRSDELAKYNQKLIKSKNVAIIGGGFVGVELAAEICTHFPEKNVTIIHASNKLLDRSETRASNYAYNFLEKHGVKVILEEKAVSNFNGEILTDKGAKVKTDVTFISNGMKCNADFMKKHFSNSLNERGAIIVNDYLLVNDSKNIFAGGDITNVQEEKTAQAAERHAEVIVRNILAIEKNGKMEKYVAKKRPIAISLGKWKGILDYGKIYLSGFIPAIIKRYVEYKTLRRYK